MATRVTIDLFSGIENPSVVLEGADELTLKAATKMSRAKSTARVDGRSWLGYRGIIIETISENRRATKRVRIRDGLAFDAEAEVRTADARAITDARIEDFVCGSTGPFRGVPGADRLFKLLPVQRKLWEKRPPIIKIPIPALSPCACAPVYEPAWWNTGGERQFGNNCYNYSANYRTETFAQPGRASGQIYPHPISGAGVHAAALRDDLIDAPLANRCPKQGHLVALVVAPGFDFHWYRKGRDGAWSHKPGGTAVTNLDNAGKAIVDPRFADRGPYVDFVGFMIVQHGHIRLQ